jgi:hypothetical protein
MKLTKDQRHTAYIILLAEAEKVIERPYLPYYIGLCWLIKDTFGLYDDGFYNPDGSTEYGKAIKYFPELEKHRQSKNKDDFWFPVDKSGWDKRISLLKQAIEETRNF